MFESDKKQLMLKSGKGVEAEKARKQEEYEVALKLKEGEEKAKQGQNISFLSTQ